MDRCSFCDAILDDICYGVIDKDNTFLMCSRFCRDAWVKAHKEV